MTLFIRLVEGAPTGNPILEQNLRQIFPNTSFPNYFTADDVEPMGYGIYDFSSQPDLTKYQKCLEVDPVRSDVGVWRQTWSVVEMSETEIIVVDAQQATQVRSLRTLKLLETDWVVLKSYEMGEEVPDDIKVFRQTLRNISEHPNFPYLADSDWPTSP